ncbi:MAG: hypothetical protein KKF89_06180 [Nanoarchaeota archaeon]|nr:hypothetical protein [Nanoarchaeota archaeon]MBU1855287.1 hypothetical protein [Nanoarchaeota archaeon]
MVNLTDKRKEWLEKLSELKKNKEKELKDFEEKKKKELKEAEEMLLASEKELSEEDILQELREQIPELKEIEKEASNKKKKTEQESLEEVVENERITDEAREQAGPAYGAPLEQLGATGIYELTDYNSYNDLRSTLEKIQNGEYISSSERENIYERQKRLEQATSNVDMVNDKDPFGYIERSKQVIQSISENFQSGGTYKSGDHI